MKGISKRNTISQRSAKSKTVSTEILSLSGVSGTWKEQLNTRRIAKALILCTAQQCIEKLAIQGFVRHIVGKVESKLQTPGRPWGVMVVALRNPAPEENFWDVEEMTPPILMVTSVDARSPQQAAGNVQIPTCASLEEVTPPHLMVTSVDARSPHQAAGNVQIPTRASFTASEVNVCEPNSSPIQKKWGNTTSTMQSSAYELETSHRSIGEPEPEFTPWKTANTILSKIMESKPLPTQKGWGNTTSTIQSPADVPETSRMSIQEPEPGFTPRKTANTILSKLMDTFHKKVIRDEDMSQCSTSPPCSSPSSFCSVSSSNSQPRIRLRRWGTAHTS